MLNLRLVYLLMRCATRQWISARVLFVVVRSWTAYGVGPLSIRSLTPLSSGA